MPLGVDKEGITNARGVNSQIFKREPMRNLPTSPGGDLDNLGPYDSNILSSPDVSRQIKNHKETATGDFFNRDVTMIE